MNITTEYIRALNSIIREGIEEFVDQAQSELEDIIEDSVSVMWDSIDNTITSYNSSVGVWIWTLSDEVDEYHQHLLDFLLDFVPEIREIYFEGDEEE